MNKLKALFLLLFITNLSFAQQQYDFAIYHDYNVGAWEDGVIAFEKFLDWKGVSHNRVTATDINTIALKNIYKAIYFPGGDADYYNADINSVGIQNIQELIAGGGAYIGMCAGAEFASDSLIWYDYRIDYPLDLFQGISIGPIDDIAIWPNNSMSTLAMNQNNEINQFESETEDMLYWGGSIFSPYADTEFDTVATFNDYNNKLAIINFTYGSGRVLLISTHPEIEENSSRDGVNVASNLDDNGTDWNFLWTATDWLLGDTLTNAVVISNIENISKQATYIYPNPTNSQITINGENMDNMEIKIYNMQGQDCSLFVKFLDGNKSRKVLDLSGLSSGMYLIKTQTTTHKVFKK